MLRPLALRFGQWDGINFCVKMLLRIGIALIGFKLSVAEFAIIGLPAFIIGIGAVITMLTMGYGVGRFLGLDHERSILSAGSVGICGASAALAISAVLPYNKERERQLSYTICLVTILSTIAMILYPAIAQYMHLTSEEAGIFLGGAIHDLTQVIGAGAIVSPKAIETATITKLIRILCLAPAVIIIAMSLKTNSNASKNGTAPPIMPWFITAFLGAALITNTGFVPSQLINLADILTSLCLVTATFALGLKTNWNGLFVDGWRPFAAIILQTIILAVAVLAGAILLTV